MKTVLSITLAAATLTLGVGTVTRAEDKVYCTGQRVDLTGDNPEKTTIGFLCLYTDFKATSVALDREGISRLGAATGEDEKDTLGVTSVAALEDDAADVSVTQSISTPEPFYTSFEYAE